MIRKYSVLLCFFSMLIISSNTQATTATLNHYLVVSSRSKPLAVSFTVANILTLPSRTGNLRTTDGNDFSYITVGNDAIPLGTLRVKPGEFFITPMGGTYSSCEVPLIPLRDVNGPFFPISYTPTTLFACIARLVPPHEVPSYLVAYNAPAMVTVADGNQIESVKKV